jgi:signal transduction histidine kinase
MRGTRRRCAPPWWPANEPWPPRRGSPAWHRRGGRVRILFFLLLMFLLVVLGASSVADYVLTRLGAPPGVGYVIPLLVWLFVVTAFVFGLRRIGSPATDIVAAAERVAGGDFSTRIEPKGARFVRTVASAFNTMTERLEAHDRQRRELMADIAHELRTPLTVIQGRLEGVLDGVYPRDDERLGAILEETRVLARLVEDLRTLANAEAGILALQREPTELPPLIYDVVRSFSDEAARKGITVQVDVPSDLPVLTVDPLRVREVIANLLSNALRYTREHDTVAISTRRSGERIIVAVRDTGAGIAPDDLPRIFDRFYKGRTSHGSGLGLTIARNLVSAHGGTIRAESEPDRGTTITFDLPVGA